MTVSEDQMETMRSGIYCDCDHSLMAGNYRPVQENVNPVYYCQKSDSDSDDDQSD